MYSQLKRLHPYLYKRVWLKGVVFTSLGLSTLFAHSLDAVFRTSRNIPPGLGISVSGILFLGVGLSVLLILYVFPKSYKLTHYILYLAFSYSFVWLLGLIYLLFEHRISSLSVVILWAYLTYNLWLIASDSGWEGAELVKDIRKQQHGQLH